MNTTLALNICLCTKSGVVIQDKARVRRKLHRKIASEVIDFGDPPKYAYNLSYGDDDVSFIFQLFLNALYSQCM